MTMPGAGSLVVIDIKQISDPPLRMKSALGIVLHVERGRNVSRYDRDERQSFHAMFRATLLKDDGEPETFFFVPADKDEIELLCLNTSMNVDVL